jgi:hypothetical protein
LIANPIGQALSGSFQFTQHLSIDLGQVEHISDAIVAVLGVDGSFAEEGEVALGPHLVVLLLVLVDAVTGLVTLVDVVETGRADVDALCDYLLAQSYQFFSGFINDFLLVGVGVFIVLLVPQFLVGL